ncbi:DUF397 domain-containing protein [Streptomyces sp. NPDC052107]|uniref:DUF397 domain-containing protein n=1 Tax=Streptomyces sp. NPDC052107 TaxID=3155632 RepID=UPI003412F83D
MKQTRTRMARELTSAGARWFKSSYSDGAGNNCMEVADLVDTPYGGVAIRDSKVPQGAALVIGRAAFAAFVEGVRPGG